MTGSRAADEPIEQPVDERLAEQVPDSSGELSAAPDETGESPSPQLPEWLIDAYEERGVEQGGEAVDDTAQYDLPEWLKEYGDMAELAAKPEAEPEQEIPDWVTNPDLLAEEPSPSHDEAHAKTQPLGREHRVRPPSFSEPEDEKEEESLPAWVAALAQSAEDGRSEVTPDSLEPEDLEEPLSFTGPEDEAEERPPAWLAELARPAEDRQRQETQYSLELEDLVEPLSITAPEDEAEAKLPAWLEELTPPAEDRPGEAAPRIEAPREESAEAEGEPAIADIRSALAEDEAAELEERQRRRTLRGLVAGGLVGLRNLVSPARKPPVEEAPPAETLPVEGEAAVKGAPEAFDEIAAGYAPEPELEQIEPIQETLPGIYPEEVPGAGVEAEELPVEVQAGTLEGEILEEWEEAPEAFRDEAELDEQTLAETKIPESVEKPEEEGAKPPSTSPEEGSRLLKILSLAWLFGRRDAAAAGEQVLSDEELDQRLGLQKQQPAEAGLAEPEDVPVEPSTVAADTDGVFITEDWLVAEAEEEEQEEQVLDLGVEEAPAEVPDSFLFEEEAPEEEPEIPPLFAGLLDEVREELAQEEPAQLLAEEEAGIRAIALEGYIEPGLEEAALPQAWPKRTSAWLASLSLAQILGLLALVLVNVVLFAVGVAILLSMILPRFITFPRPAVVEQPLEPATQLPYPARLVFPGGWDFDLQPATLQDGKWKPQQAEWLQGTEVHRWIALPWNRQLQAVFFSLQPGDYVELVMSNDDRLGFTVKSVEEIPATEVGRLVTDYPSVILILSREDSPTRWVAIVVP